MKHLIRPCRTTESYVSELINQPWARDGRHCWRLVREVQRDLFGIDLPAVLDVAPDRLQGCGVFAKELMRSEATAWEGISDPINGAVVLMRRQAAPLEAYSHAGVYLDCDHGGVLHCDHPHGVVFDSLIDLRSRRWVPSFFVKRNPCTER